MKGIEYTIRVEADGIAVTITSADPRATAELRRRAELIGQRRRTVSSSERR